MAVLGAILIVSEWITGFNWLAWVTAIAATIAVVTGLLVSRGERRPPLPRAERNLLAYIVKHEGPLGPILHPDDTRFFIIKTNDGIVIVRGSGEGVPIAPTAFVNLGHLVFIERAADGSHYCVTPAGRAAVSGRRSRFWEYEIIVRGRNLTYTGTGVGGTFWPDEFDPSGPQMKTHINQMGRNGWELVSVVTR